VWFAGGTRVLVRRNTHACVLPQVNGYLRTLLYVYWVDNEGQLGSTGTCPGACVGCAEPREGEVLDRWYNNRVLKSRVLLDRLNCGVDKYLPYKWY
jgi:hypothetical protein